MNLANFNVTTVNTFLRLRQMQEGGKKFAEVIKSNKKITHLNLETNKIGPDGIKAIAEALENNTTLKEIKLTNQVSYYCDFT